MLLNSIFAATISLVFGALQRHTPNPFTVAALIPLRLQARVPLARSAINPNVRRSALVLSRPAFLPPPRPATREVSRNFSRRPEAKSPITHPTRKAHARRNLELSLLTMNYYQ